MGCGGFPFELALESVELQADGSYLFTYAISAPLDMTGMAKTDTVYFCLRDEDGVAITDAPLAQVTVTQEANVDLPVIYSIVDSKGNDLTKTPLTLDYTSKCATEVIVHSNSKAITAWFNVNTSIDFGAPEETLLEDGTYQLVYRNVKANENVTASDIARTCVFYAYTTDAAQPDKSRALAEVRVVQDGNPKVPTAVALIETDGAQTLYNQDKPIELRVGEQRTYKLNITAEKPEDAVYKLYSDNPDAVSISYDASSSEVTVQINDDENANIYISYDQSADKVEDVPENRLFMVCKVDVIVYRALAVAMDLHEDLVGVGGIIWGTTVLSDAGISDYTSMHEAIRLSDTYKYTYIKGYFDPTAADYATYQDNLINDGVDDNDVTVLYVSAHGGKNEDKNPVEYKIAFADMSVVMSAWRDEIVDMIPGKVVFVLDSCYSGALINEFDNGNYTRKNVAVITACDTDELSGMYGSVGITGEVKNYSISTYHLTQGAGYDCDDGKISMRADDGDGELTLKEWYEYARDEMLKNKSSQNMQWWTGSKEMEELVLFGR